MVIGILRNTGTDPPLEAIGPSWSASRERSVRPSVKYIDDLKKNIVILDPLTEISGSRHVLCHVRTQRGGQGGPDPLKDHKSIGFLSNTGLLKIYKATKSAFNVGPTSARQ